MSDIAAHPLFEEPICAVLPVGHKLVGSESVASPMCVTKCCFCPIPSIAPHFFFKRAACLV